MISGEQLLGSIPRHTCRACETVNLQPFDTLWVCNNCGLISARDRKTTQVYDAQYVADRYDRYETTDQMSRLRYHILTSVLYQQETLPTGSNFSSGKLLDVGYGNGSFIRECQRHGWTVEGADVNPTPYKGVKRVPLPTSPLDRSEQYKVITFFDCLEHFEELAGVRRVAYNTDYLLLSFPYYPDWFAETPEKYKHYRPGEHHHWFTPRSLEMIFSVDGQKAEVVYCGTPEDSIRGKLSDGSDNILTCALKISQIPFVR